ncbi:GerMN domain-containing protein [Tepidimicrobium xylanilyticum]|uniref:Sporulation and spore germination n=1 Tax=Tepidimicrobium xylanilyticum TaxID=1123352 RepID=A0A1H3ASE1_9FIRM|nr:GerMN domain-containing protein [Tepidimicrobium xylanilyticum]GMG97632.1 hypothetical protein EN5CB1_24580 [Tepidimicrobium xylanilyticum]SDX32044.1 Sporulation and spore germination [Tepidimicrobium xylanilyticum]
MKRFVAIFLLAIMVFSLSACNKSNAPSNENDISKEEPIEVEEDEIIEPTPNTDEMEVTLYFANKEYIETGDESLEKLIPEKRVIQYGDISLEEMIVKELMKGPESEELSTVIPSNVKLLGVEVADGTAFVNFSSEGLYGGSLQEDFTIDQIVNSLVELGSVDRVQFLVDGQKAETLMGHIEITEPFEP